MKIPGVLLAAGSSSRMGATNKLLLDFNGHTIIEEVVTQLLDSKLEELFIVTGYEADKIQVVLKKLTKGKTTFVYNKNYQQGRAASIQCAVNQVIGKSQALLFMVADKPRVPSSLIDFALDTFEKEQPDILYVQTPSGRGHPIIFSEKLFPELLALDGDLIGNSIIEKHIANTIVIKDSATQLDIDTHEDYISLINWEI